MNYTPPTVDEIRDFLERNGVSHADAAEKVNIKTRTFRRYVASNNPKTMQYAVWFTLKAKVRVALMESSDNGRPADVPPPKPPTPKNHRPRG